MTDPTTRDSEGVPRQRLVEALAAAKRLYESASKPHWQAEPYYYSPQYRWDSELFSEVALALGLQGFEPRADELALDTRARLDSIVSINRPSRGVGESDEDFRQRLTLHTK